MRPGEMQEVKPHKDSKNVDGTSYLMHWGKFEGALLRDENGCSYGNPKTWYIFNGRDTKHWVERLERGVRYSIVAYRLPPYAEYKRKKKMKEQMGNVADHDSDDEWFEANE